MPHVFLTESYLINIDFRDHGTGEITAGAYLVSITEVISSCQLVRGGALLIVSDKCICMFDSHSKDENRKISAYGTTSLLKFESLSSLDSYIRLVY